MVGSNNNKATAILPYLQQARLCLSCNAFITRQLNAFAFIAFSHCIGSDSCKAYLLWLCVCLHMKSKLLDKYGKDLLAVASCIFVASAIYLFIYLFVSTTWLWLWVEMSTTNANICTFIHIYKHLCLFYWMKKCVNAKAVRWPLLPHINIWISSRYGTTYIYSQGFADWNTYNLFTHLYRVLLSTLKKIIRVICKESAPDLLYVELNRHQLVENSSKWMLWKFLTKKTQLHSKNF